MKERALIGSFSLATAGWALFTLGSIAFINSAALPQQGGMTGAVITCVLVAAIAGILGIVLLGIGNWPRSSGVLLFGAGLGTLALVLPLRLFASAFEPHATAGVISPPELMSNWKLGGPILAGMLLLGLALWITSLWIYPREVEKER